METCAFSASFLISSALILLNEQKLLSIRTLIHNCEQLFLYDAFITRSNSDYAQCEFSYAGLPRSHTHHTGCILWQGLRLVLCKTWYFNAWISDLTWISQSLIAVITYKQILHQALWYASWKRNRLFSLRPIDKEETITLNKHRSRVTTTSYCNMPNKSSETNREVVCFQRKCFPQYMHE